MRNKFTVIIAAAALLLATSAVAAPKHSTLPPKAQHSTPAPAKPVCESPESFNAAQDKTHPFRHSALVGDELKAYIDGFNKVTGSDQPYDFSRIEVYEFSETAIGWVFFENGCYTATTVVPHHLHDEILNAMGDKNI